jgi:predicted nuclease of predicted toxin-antitoxin system
MRILFDENMPQITAALLREYGHEVHRQNDSAADREVLEMARLLGSLLITYDKDFGDLMF